MNMRATLYAVVSVLVMVITVPWACTGGEQQRRNEDMDDEVEQRRGAMVDAGDTGEVDEAGLDSDAGDAGLEETDRTEIGDAGDAGETGDAEMIDGEADAGGIEDEDEGVDERDEGPGGYEGDPSETSLGGPGDESGGGNPGRESDEPNVRPAQAQPLDAGRPGRGGDTGTGGTFDTGMPPTNPGPAEGEPTGDNSGAAGGEIDETAGGEAVDAGRDAGTMQRDVGDAGDVGDTGVTRDADAGGEETGIGGLDRDVGEPDTEPSIEYEVESPDTGP